MKKRKNLKLTLSRETLRTLNGESLSDVAGGVTFTKCILSDCVCDFTRAGTCFCTVVC